MPDARQYRIAEYGGGTAFPFNIGPAFILHGEFHAHTHDFVELVVILGGSSLHEVNGRTYRVGAGDIYVLNRGATHAFHNSQSLELVNVMYAPKMLETVGSDTRCLPGFQSLFVISISVGGEYRCTLHLAGRALSEVRRLLGLMATEFRAKLDGHQTMLRSQLAQLVVLLSRGYSSEGARVDGPRMALRLADIASYIESHYSEPLALDSLANRAGLSRRHFVRLFARLYGTTPMSHVLDLRLERAARMLSETDLPVGRVALLSGFEDSNYFARQFKARRGMSPKKWRFGQQG